MLLLSPMSPTRALAAARTAHLDTLLGPAAVARRDAIRARWRAADDEEIVALCHEAIEMTFRHYLLRAEMLPVAAFRCNIPPAAIRNRLNVEAATMASLGEWDSAPAATADDARARHGRGEDQCSPRRDARLGRGASQRPPDADRGGRPRILPRPAGGVCPCRQPVPARRISPDRRGPEAGTRQARAPFTVRRTSR